MSAAEQKSLLMDATMIVAELGVSRAIADKIIRDWCSKRAGVTRPEGIRKKYVHRIDVEAWVADNTRRAA
jgi:hypothetical protein